METIKHIACAAGKSGGHIISNLNWANQRYPNTSIQFFSADTPLDFRILKNKQIHHHIPLHIPSSHRWYQIPLILFFLCYATIKSFYQLIRNRPSVILSTGGIIAVPVCIAGWFLRIPIELFELNATPGIAIRWLTPLASTIHVCFKRTKSFFSEKRCVVSRYPVRHMATIQSKPIFADSNRFTLFIQGGSQGSQFLNKKAKEIIQEKKEMHNKIQIIHQTGSTDFDWKQFYTDLHIPSIVFDFEDNLAPYYHAANLILCRSGAGQLFESLYFKKFCITIPLEISGNDHQLKNAYAILEEYPEQFVLIRQHNLNSNVLFSSIQIILKSQSPQNQSDRSFAHFSH